MANVILVYKSKDPNSNMKNRPIFLLSCPCDGASRPRFTKNRTCARRRKAYETGHKRFT